MDKQLTLEEQRKFGHLELLANMWEEYEKRQKVK